LCSEIDNKLEEEVHSRQITSPADSKQRCTRSSHKNYVHAVTPAKHMAEARAAYRSLFRSLSKHVSSETNSKWHAYARKEFDRLAKVGDTRVSQQALQTAKDYADLINSIDKHKVTDACSQSPLGRSHMCQLCWYNCSGTLPPRMLPACSLTVYL